jgi:hypothetical protein
MQTEFFNDAFTTPLYDDTSFTSPPSISTFQWEENSNQSPEREPTPPSLDIDSDGDSDNEDGLHGGVTAADHALEDEDGSFGDNEHVVVGAKQHSWKIDHATGDHKLKGMFLSSAWLRRIARRS